MEIQVSVHDWLALPMLVRIKMREIFGVKKSQGSLVEGNVVKSDGTTYEDLKAITLEKMQAYVDSQSSDFVSLFNACVDKIVEADKELEPIEKVDPNEVILQEWGASISRMIAQAQTLDLTEHLRILINKLLPYDNARRKEVKQEGAKSRGTKTAKARS